MLKHKTFLRKTKQGKILKIVREHYLRDDLWCGSSACKECKNENPVLDYSPTSVSTLCTVPHYLLLDTNIVLNQIDVLEEDALKNVIVLQTVLDEVRHKSSPIYKRLCDLITNPARNFYVFVNEHHKDTYVERKRGESANDRNDCAIRRSCSWYQSHLSQQQSISKKRKLQTVLLTDDKQNREIAIEEGITVFTSGEYIKSLSGTFPTLEDKLSHKTFLADGISRGPLFPEHLSPLNILKGIKSGNLRQGSFMASRENYLEGSCNVEGIDEMVLIQGRENLNRAVDGDIVAIELFAKDKWSAPSEVVLEDEGYLGDDDALELDDNLLNVKRKKVLEAKPTGRVVGIVRRKWRMYCGILQKNLVEGSVRHLFAPAERKIPKIRIETRNAEALCTQRIIITIDEWPRNSRYPLGHFVRALGPIGDKNTENEVLLLEHDVPHSKFSEAVLKCLPKLPWIITEKDIEERVDLRNLDICSVDPPGCTDIDDALHCRELGNGKYEVGVHIADVSHFIRPGTAIDSEAALRGTTVYLVDKRIDMVPELLSSNLCSLRGHEERFAFSVIWQITKEAKVIKTSFCKSLINSKGAFTYKEAQMIIEDKNQQHSIAKSLRGLNTLAKILKKRRIENGALVLASTEVRFHVDSETHDPIDVDVKQMLETNSMVEEFMLLANISVAQKICDDFPECAVLRRHPEPPLPNFDPLIKAGRAQGFEIKVDNGKMLATSLDLAVRADNRYFNTMLRILATRCMLQAVYFCSGMVEEVEYKHYGLGVPIYTHFTSPIRRYSDIMVHRLLAVTIGADATFPQLLNKSHAQTTCNNLNYRHRMAQYAGRASVALNTHVFFRNKILEEDGYVLLVRQNALQILIPRYGLEGTIYLKSREGQPSFPVNFTFDDAGPTQTCGNVVIRPFDPVVVRLSLDQSNIQREKLILVLVKPAISGFSVQSSNEESVIKMDDVEIEEIPPLPSTIVRASRSGRKRKVRNTKMTG